MSFVVPWDGAYRMENVAYFEQNIGLRYHDIIIAGRHEDATDPRIKVSSWTSISSHYYLVLITFAVGSQSHQRRWPEQDNHPVRLPIHRCRRQFHLPLILKFNTNFATVGESGLQCQTLWMECIVPRCWQVDVSMAYITCLQGLT